MANLAAYITQITGSIFRIESLESLDIILVEKGNLERWGILPRFSGLYAEPTHASFFLLPWIYITRKPTLKLIGYTLILCSFSLVVYVGLMAFFIILNRGWYIIFTGAILTLTLFFLDIGFIAMRIQDVLGYIDGKEILNPSILAVTTNFEIALKNLHNNPLFGGGLASHRVNYNLYIKEVSETVYFSDFYGLNATDASGLYFLIISEFGLVGMIGIITFLIRKSKNNTRRVFKIAFLVSALRFGVLSSLYLIIPFIMSIAARRYDRSC